mmetsp:Transcript_16564/g.56459  ORF Transcript_16564/g.56459 Transcript_16564/m.56459 type:complete len:249 (+) Transcript_16564:2377-3123(+)
MWAMSVTTLSMNSASCVTSSVVAFCLLKYPASQSMLFLSRWFVGSSASSRSASCSMARAMDSFIFHPPLSSPTRPVSCFSLKPISVSVSWISWSPTSVSRRMNCSGVWFPFTISCLMYTTLMSCGKPMMSRASMRFISVVLPVPLRPTRPYTWPFSSLRSVRRRSTLPAKARMMPSILTRYSRPSSLPPSIELPTTSLTRPSQSVAMVPSPTKLSREGLISSCRALHVAAKLENELVSSRRHAETLAT